MIKNVLILGDEYEEKWNAIATEMRIADCYTTTYKGSDKATGKNYTRVLSLAEDNAIDTVFFGKEYRNIGNKLLWQVKSVQRIIMYGVECPLMIEEDNPEIESKAWDRIAKIAKDDNPIAQTGWRDSFSGELIGDDEIDEFCNNVKVKLLPHINKDRDVLEIGFASGFTCMTLAPYANKYYGIDLSNVTVEKTQKRMSDMGIDNTELVVGDGLHINQVLKDVQVDVVILNSVIQYFPGYNYFLKVIENAISMIKNKGYIFIGDILDYDKKAEFDKLVIERGGKRGKYKRFVVYKGVYSGNSRILCSDM